jgi:hypothetical protein
MSDGWAIVIGAAIALVGSIGAPWAKEAADRKGRVREAQRLALREVIEDLVDAIAEGMLARTDLERGAAVRKATVLSTRFSLLLDGKDGGLESIVVHTIVGITTSKAANLTSAMQIALHRWFRGDDTADEAVRRWVDLTSKSIRGPVAGGE